MKRKAAFISVYNRKYLVEFADILSKLGYSIYASGHTHKYLLRADIKSVRIRREEQGEVISSVSWKSGKSEFSFSVVVADLYPMEKILSQKDFRKEELSEYIDIFNSSLLRAAAANFSDTVPVCDYSDYQDVLDLLGSEGGVPYEKRMELSAKAFNYCAYYDAAVSNALSRKEFASGPGSIILPLAKAMELGGRSGSEKAGFYRYFGSAGTGIAAAEILAGKKFGANHCLDADLSLKLLSGFPPETCVCVRHGHIKGLACGKSGFENIKALEKNIPFSIVAFSGTVDAGTAEFLALKGPEAVMAVDYTPEALACLRGKRKIKILSFKPLIRSPDEVEIRSVSGGLIIMEDSPETGLSPQAGQKTSSAESNLAVKAWHAAKTGVSYCGVFSGENGIFALGDGSADEKECVEMCVGKFRKEYPILGYNEILAFACDMPIGRAEAEKLAECKISVLVCPAGERRENEKIASLCRRKKIKLFWAPKRAFLK